MRTDGEKRPGSEVLLLTAGGGTFEMVSLSGAGTLWKPENRSQRSLTLYIHLASVWVVCFSVT